MLSAVRVRVPASSANLGPGFDTLALALDLWNDASFTLGGEGFQVRVEGEGHALLAKDEHNLVAQAVIEFYNSQGLEPPAGMRITCTNRIPLSSGMGSSAAAVLAGLLGANALLGEPLAPMEILEMASEMEGHPDNVAAALLGGLVVIATGLEGLAIRRFDMPPLTTVVVVPALELSTHQARAVLPKNVPLSDATFNISRVALVVEALRSRDLGLLGQAMQDRLHQPYRLQLLPGCEAALIAARGSGAAAAALSGAGPSLIAFTADDPSSVAEAMQAALQEAGVSSQRLILSTSNRGAEVSVMPQAENSVERSEFGSS